MTSVEDMTLDLPDPIEAEPGKIRSGADDLDELHNDMLGQSGDTDSQIRSSADQFTDRIAWDIRSASADDLMAWEEASKALTYGGGVLRLWAEDIDTYMTDRASIVSRWEVAKENAQGPDMGPGPSNADFLERRREELRSEHAGIWGTLMDHAEQTKIDLRTGPSLETMERMVEAGLLTAGQIATYGDHYPGMVPDEIDGSEPPHLVNAWWDSLSEDEREQAMADDRDLLRDLDGIPSNVRDQLNRDHLQDEHEAVQAELDELRGELEEAQNGPGGSIERTSLNQEIRELEEQEKPLAELRDELGESADKSGRYLLAFDSEDKGRAIVSQGNPDTADNVATLIPGTGTTWEGMTGENEQLERIEHIREAAEDADETGADHATISWIGYDAPSNLLDATNDKYAEDAEHDLNSFQSGVRATNENSNPSENIVIGHSYGSTVIGHSAQGDDGLNADRIALVGSPGTNADHASELGFLPEDIHATTSESDSISGVPPSIHGEDPHGSDFGSERFSSDAETGHGEYFKEDTTSVEELGEIVANGQTEE